MPSPRCPDCQKPVGLCVCDRTVLLPQTTPVLILQHPDEPDEVLGTTRLLQRSLPLVRVSVGRTWPSLAAAWGEPIRPADWGVLWSGSLPESVNPADRAAPAVVLDRQGHRRTGPLTGIVALDGTWSGAKSLWWRNPWLVQLPRIVLHPKEASLYGRVRKEPHRGALSTLEAVAEALTLNGEPPEVREQLRRLMRTMVQRARDTAPGQPRRTHPTSAPPNQEQSG